MKKYIILSLSHSTIKEAIFWRADNAGYTKYPWAAGIYTEEQVTRDPEYYNDGFKTIAICLTDGSLEKSGLVFKLNMPVLKKFIANNRFRKPINQEV
ncbi:MAG TPA: hypothetical protein VGK59_23865 [Ohtaekwangia sp.]